MASDFITIQAYQAIVLVAIRRTRLIDVREITEVAQVLQKQIDCHPKISLVLDLSQVQAMSSQMLAKLVAVHKAVVRDRGRLALAGVDKQLMPLFKTTRLHKVFDFYPDAEQVLLLYRRKPL